MNERELKDAGDAVREIAERELKRMIALGEQLAAATPRGADPEALEEAQQRNLAALERMTADVGITALETARRLVAALEAKLDADAAAATAIDAEIKVALDRLVGLQDAAADGLARRLRDAARGGDQHEPKVGGGHAA